MGRFAQAIRPESTPDAKRNSPLRTITLEPTAFVDGWDKKPRKSIAVGIRSLPSVDVDAAESEGRRVADESATPGTELWTEVYNETLMRWAVARGICDPNDVTKEHPHVPMAEDTVGFAFTKQTIRYVYDTIERVCIESSPLYLEADDDDLHELSALLCADEPLAGLTQEKAMRVRRYLRFALDELLEAQPEIENIDELTEALAAR